MGGSAEYGQRGGAGVPCPQQVLMVLPVQSGTGRSEGPTVSCINSVNRCVSKDGSQRCEVCASFCGNVDLGCHARFSCHVCTWIWANTCPFSKLVPLPFQPPPSRRSQNVCKPQRSAISGANSIHDHCCSPTGKSVPSGGAPCGCTRIAVKKRRCVLSEALVR